MILRALIITIAIELGIWKIISLIFKNHGLKYFIHSIIAVNLITNILLNLLLLFIMPESTFSLLVIALELVIIIIEALIFYIIYRRHFKKFLLISATLNISSYLGGILISYLGFLLIKLLFSFMG
jgi:hypothetical protein